MGTIEGLTKARMLEIEGNSVVSGAIDDTTGHLILTQHDGDTIDAGKARPDTFLDASETNKGVTTLATQAEVNAGTNGTEIVTPATLTGRIATQAETNTGTDTKKLLSPALLAGQLATQAEVNAGTDTKKLITPATLPAKVDLQIAAKAKGTELADGTDLNTLRTPGNFTVSTAGAANSVKNWPVEAIPRSDKADSNNPVGSYRSGSVGILNVRVDDTGRVIQEVEIFVNTGAGLYATPYGLTALMFKRVYSAVSAVWGPWILSSPSTIPILNWAEKNSIARNFLVGNATSRSPADMLYYNGGTDVRSSIYPPVRETTHDGVQFWREATQTRSSTPNWMPLTWSGGMADYGAGWPSPAVLRTSLGIIVVRGLGTGTPAAGATIATLPPGYRPAHRKTIVVPSTTNLSGTYLQVWPDGRITFVTSAVSGSIFISLDMMFPAADEAPDSAWTQITDFNTGWSDYGITADTSFTKLGWWRDRAGRVWQKGLTRRSAAPTATEAMFYLPAALATYPIMHWATLAGSAQYLGSGYFQQLSGKQGVVYNWSDSAANAWTFMSMDQVLLLPTDSAPQALWRGLGFANGWGNYDPAETNYPKASVYMAPDGIAHWRGLITGGARGGTPATSALGVNDRAATQRMNVIPTNAQVSRADYALASNTVQIIGGNNGWASLYGLHYMTEA